MKSDEEIINEALNSTGVIPDTRANLILCKKILEIKEKEMLDEQIKFLELIFSNGDMGFTTSQKVQERLKELNKELK